VSFKIALRFRIPRAIDLPSFRPRQICPLGESEFVLAGAEKLWHFELKNDTPQARFVRLPASNVTLFDPAFSLQPEIPVGPVPSVAGDFGPHQILAATSFGNIYGWDLRSELNRLFECQHPHPRALYFDAGISVLYVGCGDYPLDASRKPHAWLEAWQFEKDEFQFVGATMLPGVCLEGIVACFDDDFAGMVCYSGNRSQQSGHISLVDRLTLRVYQQIEVPIAMLNGLAVAGQSVLLGSRTGLCRISLADESIVWHKPDEQSRFAFDGESYVYLANGAVLSISDGESRGQLHFPSRCDLLQMDSTFNLIGVGETEVMVWMDQ
jgi:hypothetical protein